MVVGTYNMNICIEISRIAVMCKSVFPSLLFLWNQMAKLLCICYWKSAGDPFRVGCGVFSCVTAQSRIHHLEQCNYGKHCLLRPRLKEIKHLIMTPKLSPDVSASRFLWLQIIQKTHPHIHSRHKETQNMGWNSLEELDSWFTSVIGGLNKRPNKHIVSDNFPKHSLCSDFLTKRIFF